MAYQLIIHGANADTSTSNSEATISAVEALAGHSEITLGITHLNAFPDAEVDKVEYLNNEVYSEVNTRLGFEVKTQLKSITDQLGGGTFSYAELMAVLKLPYLFLEFDGTFYDVVSDIETKALAVALTDLSVKYEGKKVAASQVTMKFVARETI